ncbi:MAG TPA: type III pantothenate kinase [Chitinophagales bacterium]|nr:type III pantothenate kinase [Chitinophagales bacterium]
MNLALDFGNSRVKAAIFDQRKLVHIETHFSFSIKKAAAIIRKFNVDSSILASVIHESKEIRQLLKKNTRFIKLDSSTPVPITNHYETPGTLGADRLANLIGGRSLFSRKNILVISAGTCITYDVITSEGNYFGGNITPGLDLRLKAMNTFTARLPLVKKEMTNELFGRTTATSMLSGVIKGTSLEMKGFISEYKKEYQALKIILTGGDAPYFEKMIAPSIPYGKSKTFALPHLLLYGLNEILLINNA